MELGPKARLVPNGRWRVRVRMRDELSHFPPFLAADFKSLSIPILSIKGNTHTHKTHTYSKTGDIIAQHSTERKRETSAVHKVSIFIREKRER